MAGAIITAAARADVASGREQLEYTLGLVCSGRVTRECGVQRELIDTLVDAGADPDTALLGALAHKETTAHRLGRRRAVRAGANTEPPALGVDVNGYGPPEFHPHATALHHAVDSGSLAAVTVLVEAGARLDVKDRVYHAVPHEWAAHLNQPAIADYLRGQRSSQ